MGLATAGVTDAGDARVRDLALPHLFGLLEMAERLEAIPNAVRLRDPVLAIGLHVAGAHSALRCPTQHGFAVTVSQARAWAAGRSGRSRGRRAVMVVPARVIGFRRHEPACRYNRRDSNPCRKSCQ